MQKKNKPGNMNFKCKQLTITDDPDFGCTIEFSDSEKKHDEHTPIEEILHPRNKYLLIQRSYPQDEYENDWYSIESSESDTELNYKDDMIIRLRRDSFEINWTGEQLNIGLKITDKEYLQLEEILKTRFKERVTLL